MLRRKDTIRSIWRASLGLLAVGLMAIFAFAFTFTRFAHFDDEGYFLYSYRAFLSGQAPYDRIFSFYGPFSFLSSALVARFNPLNVNHDTFRWFLLPVWILIALLVGGVVWRWTRLLSVGLIGFLLIGFNLHALAGSSGHPQLWILLAVVVLLWLGLDWIYLPGDRGYALCTGIAIGIIFLCKINIALFVSVAIALAASLQIKGRTRVILSVILLAAAAGLGVLLLFSTSVGSEKYFALVYLLSLAATCGIASSRPGERQLSVASLIWMVAGLGICLCIGVGAILACGTTLSGLFKGLVTGPVLLVKRYHSPFLEATYPLSIFLSILGLGAAIAVFAWGRRYDASPAWLGPLKVAVGVVLLCPFYYQPRQALTGSLLFSWLLLVDDQAISPQAYSDRLLLALLCSLFSLQLFPNAGTQVYWAALLPIAAAAVMLADGINSINHRSYEIRLSRVTSLVARGAGPVIAIALFLIVGKNAVSGYQRWLGAEPVNLPGAHWLRLSQEHNARLAATVNELSRECRTVMTIPGLYSYSLWSGVPPAEEKQINSWPFLWPREVQENELPRLRRQDGGCVLVDREVYQFFRMYATSDGSDELLSEVERTMRAVFVLQGLTLYKPSQTPAVFPDSGALKHKDPSPTGNK